MHLIAELQSGCSKIDRLKDIQKFTILAGDFNTHFLEMVDPGWIEGSAVKSFLRNSLVEENMLRRS